MKELATPIGLEPTIFAVTGRRVNHYTTGPNHSLEPPIDGERFSDGIENDTGSEHAPDSDALNCSPTPERTLVLSTADALADEALAIWKREGERRTRLAMVRQALGLCPDCIHQAHEAGQCFVPCDDDETFRCGCGL